MANRQMVQRAAERREARLPPIAIIGINGKGYLLVHGIRVRFLLWPSRAGWDFIVPGLGNASTCGLIAMAFKDCAEWISVNRARFPQYTEEV